MGIGYIILYFFVFFRTGFFGGCVWDDGLILHSGGVEIHWVFYRLSFIPTLILI